MSAPAANEVVRAGTNRGVPQESDTATPGGSDATANPSRLAGLGDSRHATGSLTSAYACRQSERRRLPSAMRALDEAKWVRRWRYKIAPKPTRPGIGDRDRWHPGPSRLMVQKGVKD